MKYTSRQIEHRMHLAVQKYGSVMNSPSDMWTDIRRDFNNDDQVVTHFFEDEDSYFWNNPLRTDRIKLFNVAKLLREPSNKLRKRVLHKLHMKNTTYSNIIYQYHMCHRGYAYFSNSCPPLYCSYRDEIVGGIIKNHIPGPRTESFLTDILHHNGIYRPNKNDVIQGVIKRFFMYRKIIYYSNKMHMQDNRPSIILPQLRIYHHQQLIDAKKHHFYMKQKNQ